MSDGITNLDFHVRQYRGGGENAVYIGGEINGGHRIEVSEAALKKVTSLITAIKKAEEDITSQTKFLAYTEEIEKMQKAEASLFPPSSTELSAAITALDNYRTTLNSCKVSLPVREDTDIKAHKVVPSITHQREGRGTTEFDDDKN